MTSRRSGSEDDGTYSTVFERLHPGLQRWIWSENWSSLHEVQERAIPVLHETHRDVLIGAATAGGKTEAAFLPILSRAAGDLGEGFSALCLSPLKALINDQYRRLEAMAAAVDVSVYRWHGDVSQSDKMKAIRKPSGLLLITPESLEAMFVRRGPEVKRLFARLSHVVIDELHVFIGTERGRQVQSLLHRLELSVRQRIPRVGLSATIGDMAMAAGYLRPGEGEKVVIVESSAGGGEIRLQVRGYEDPSRAITESDDEDADGAFERIARHLCSVLRGSRNLIFINRKSDVERYADRLRRLCQAARVPNEFVPHHGSLSKGLREDAERMLKGGDNPVSAVCTSTLELGIDIGAVESIAQVGAPPAVSSMRQRLGRSGRRGNPATLRIYVREPEITPRSRVLDHLRLEAFESVAMTRLMIQRWCEPPSPEALHLSTLIQQILSVIAQLGGVRAEQLWKALCRSGPFGNVDAPMFSELLRCLGAKDLIVQSSDGLLLPGELGERLVNHYEFYSAFTTDREYVVDHDGKALGSIPVHHALIPGQMLVFAGRRWTVASVDEERKRISVTPARGGTPPRFGGGGAPVHSRVRQEMFRLYVDGTDPGFVDAGATALLAQGRDAFERMRLRGSRFYQDGNDCLVFLWAGDRSINTILAMITKQGVKASTVAGCLFVSDTRERDLIRMLEGFVAQPAPDPEDLASAVANKQQEKYDRYLSERMLCAEYASRDLDLPEALDCIEGVLRGASPISE